VRRNGWPLLKPDDNDRNGPAGHVLLITHVLVGRQEDLEARVLGHGQEVAVLQRFPVFWRRRAHGVAGQKRASGPGWPDRTARAVSGWPLTCRGCAPQIRQRLSPGRGPARRTTLGCRQYLPPLRGSRKSSRRACVCCGAHAPLTLPGMLSTAGQWDQSSTAIVQSLPNSSVRDLASSVTSRWRSLLHLQQPDPPGGTLRRETEGRTRSLSGRAAVSSERVGELTPSEGDIY
jgi:hypothetical protein